MMNLNLMKIIILHFAFQQNLFPYFVLAQDGTLSNITARQLLKENAEHVINETFRYLLLEQMRYCSLDSVCSIENPNNDSNSCCSPCSCDSDCSSSGSCCLDKVLADGTMDLTLRQGKACVAPQLLPYQDTLLNSYNFFLMREKCNSAFFNTTFEEMCLSGQDFPTEPEITLYLPVSSIVTEQAYRNKYCAYCNGEDENNLVYWSTSFSCISSKYLIPSDAQDFLNFIITERKCNVFYLPPSEKLSVPCQRPPFDKCNITGLWKAFDSRIDWACTHFYNPYSENKYKNVFCYLCNEENPFPMQSCFFPGYSNVDNQYGFESFAALFNFIKRDSLLKSAQFNLKCPSESRYDPPKNICREITCMTPFVYKEGQCKNIFSNVASQRYEVFLRFNKADSYNSNCEFCHIFSRSSIYGFLKAKLTELGLWDMTCYISILSEHDICSSDHSDTKYYFAFVELYFQDFHDVYGIAKQILNTTLLKIDYKGPFLCVILQPEVVGGDFYDPLLRDAQGYIENYINPLNDHELLVIDNQYGGGICMDKPWVTRLTKAFTCPLVNLSLTEFNITKEGDKICLDNERKCISSNEYVYRENETHILVCADNYFKQEVSPSNVMMTTNNARAVVSVAFSCLSIICLLVTFITYLLFPVLRTLPGLYTMTLCGTLIVAHSLFTFGAGATNISVGCEVIGILIHFTMLASVFLMNVSSFHMFQVFKHLDRQRILSDTEKRQHFILGLVYSFVTSSIFVAAEIIYSVIKTGKSGYGQNICFINKPNPLLVTFTLPIMVLVLANIIMFCTVVFKVSRLPDMTTSCRSNQKRFLIYVKLSSLTGATWLFGFLSELCQSDVLAYIFIVLIASQGIFIMFSFVVNKRVYGLYFKLIKRKRSSSGRSTHIYLSQTLENSQLRSSNPPSKAQEKYIENSKQEENKDFTKL